MTREIVAHHDSVVRAAAHGGAALAVQRWTPALSLVELLKHATRSGPARRAIQHVHRCGAYLIGGVCPVGARLAQAIGRRRARRRRAT
jgi:prolyl-tRNA editing enzyme YbaK/EbsC (Cys-tRNA(Pro) deacylase)